MEQLFNVNTQRRKTVNNKSMKKIHEKAVTDVVSKAHLTDFG